MKKSVRWMHRTQSARTRMLFCVESTVVLVRSSETELCGLLTLPNFFLTMRESEDTRVWSLEPQVCFQNTKSIGRVALVRIIRQPLIYHGITSGMIRQCRPGLLAGRAQH